MNTRPPRPRSFLRRHLRAPVLRIAIALNNFVNRARKPTLIGENHITGLERIFAIYPSTILSVRRTGENNDTGHITLGAGVYLGRRVELEAGEIEIGESTTLQDGGAVRGNVKVGAHCLLGHNVLVISSSHRFMDIPEWLIADQDVAYESNKDRYEDGANSQIHIEDDCWLGWSCAVMRGVYVGRGAIISANSLVVNNVGPYEIHGGSPNRKIGARLSFDPPISISALRDADLPYFYRGFLLSRTIIEQSRVQELALCGPDAAVVLAQGGDHIRLTGVRLDGEGTLKLRFWWNGADLGCREIPPGPFDLLLSNVAPGATQSRAVPSVLAQYTLLEWQAEDFTPGDAAGAQPVNARYGVSTAEIVV